MPKPKHAWMVRAGNDNVLAETIEQKNAIAIGWEEMQDLSNLKTRDQFKQHYRETYTEDSDGRIPVNAGQVYRFVQEIHDGDYVVTYIKDRREILIGLAEGSYEYRP